MKKTLLLLLTMFMAISSQAIEKIKVGTTTREIISYAPKNLPSSPALIIACHGYNQDAPYLQTYAKFETLADTAKFVVVYANGEGKSWDISGTKDIKFMETIIDSMYARYHINKNRVYLTGFSMGGMFTYHCANNMSDKIAAFCPVSGYPMSGPNAASPRPVPILHTHGTADETCGYSSAQSHVDAWVKHNGCNTVPEVINNYPRSSCSSSLKRYRNGKNGVEVAFLTLPGKGHWWSMDTSLAMTSVEVWNFCKRFSLGPDKAEVTKVVPEANSFDMVASVNNTFEVTFNEDVDCSKIEASLNSSKGNSIKLNVKSEGMQSVVTFSIPEGTEVEDGKQTLTIKNAINKAQAIMDSYSVSYTFGVQELGEEIEINYKYQSDFYSVKDAVGEGIPSGWKRVVTKSDGTTEETKGKAANISGSRLKYFEQGGDFDAGFYLSARDQSSCAFYYGHQTGYRIALGKGNYTVSFNSVYWSQDSYNNNATFTFSIEDASQNCVMAAPSLLSTGCMADNSAQKISGSANHELNFSITTAGMYNLCFEMNEGWNSVVIGNIRIYTQLTPAEKYKGDFRKALTAAKQALNDYAETGNATLKSLVEKYESFSTISPTEYTKATEELNKARKNFISGKTPLAIDSANTMIENSSIFDLSGRKVSNDMLAPGIYISNGKKFMVK